MPDPKTERERYLQHENDMGNVGYRRFLSRLVAALSAHVEPPKLGLDFGCGPNPVLAALLAESGHSVDCYDPLFFPYKPAARYDFITVCETCEHFHYPGKEFSWLRSMLKPGGYLAVMTAMLQDEARFVDWYYVRDWTHVSFYQPATFAYIAESHGMSIVDRRERITIMRA